jgi:membrane-associated phospholipid phosphatase
MLDLLAKIISILPFLFFIFLGIINTYLFFNNLNNFKRVFLYSLGISSATIFSESIKKGITPPKWLRHIWYRPKGAKGCDYLSIKGYTPDFTPGFPSGHMSTTSYFVSYNILKLFDTPNTPKRTMWISVNLLILLLMGWARMQKKCHTFIQVAGGSIFGSIIGFCFYTLDKLI